MKRSIGSLVLAAIAVFFGSIQIATAQEAQSSGKVIVPESSIEHPGDAGVRAHTTFVIHQEEGIQPDNSKPGATWETPASLACVYNLVPRVAGCPISGTTAVPTGGSGAIALVDAFDNPNAAQDLSTFSTQFGLPQANFLQVYASGHKPANDPGGWSLEEALDIEWAHAMAPNAQIILVEAASNSDADLFAAEAVASSMVAAAGGGEVSNSWGQSEFSGETANDINFTTSGVVYFASSGDSPGVIYPSASPNVVSAGGTSVNRSGGNFRSETAWSSGGGGASSYEARPPYQNNVQSVVGTKRGTPDFSFDANPNTGVAVFDADGGFNWIQVGGTSVSSPSLAGIVNSAGHFYISSKLQDANIYTHSGNPSNYRDITSGSCGTHSAALGYDLCTGVGSDIGYVGK